jgi:YidC/Oxa1 family membrane protein insertase
MTSLYGVPVDAAYHIVTTITRVLTPVAGGLAAVTAIIVVTLIVRAALMPLSLRALRGQAAQARLLPKMAELRNRYRDRPERLQRELTALYKREGTTPFAGFAPLLLQMPVLGVVYLLFRSPVVSGHPNTLLGHRLFTAPLGAHWLSAPGVLSAQGAVFIGIFALLAALCWLAARLARAAAVASPPEPAVPARRATAANSPVPVQPAGAGAVARVLPYVTVVIAAFAPLAAGVYLATSTAWSVVERWVYRRRAKRGQAAQAGPPAAPRRVKAHRDGPSRTARL